nr:hypothetical protein CFP56_11096 [Quercus suber]
MHSAIADPRTDTMLSAVDQAMAVEVRRSNEGGGHLSRDTVQKRWHRGEVRRRCVGRDEWRKSASVSSIEW